MKAIVKLDSGKISVLCSKCRIVIKSGSELSEEEKESIFVKNNLEAQYCEKCKKLENGKND